MATLSQAWLREHEVKIAMQRGRPLISESIRFTIGPTILLPQWQRMGWADHRNRLGQLVMGRTSYMRKLSEEISSRVPTLPRAPFERAVVWVVRHSLQMPAVDGLIGGLKPTIDCLLVRSDRHPVGLGFIRDDDPAHLTVHANSSICATRAEQRTVVLIESG